MALTINHIIQAAERDLESCRHNAALKTSRNAYKKAGASSRAAGDARGMTFLPAHVMRAARPSEVIRAAIRKRSDGMGSSNLVTREVYSDISRLRAAAQLAEAYGY